MSQCTGQVRCRQSHKRCHYRSGTPLRRPPLSASAAAPPLTTAAPDPPHGTSADLNADDLQRQRRRLPATAPLAIVTSLSMPVNPPVQGRVSTATGANEKGGGYNGDEAQVGEWGTRARAGCQLSARVGTVTSGARSSGGRGAGSGKPQIDEGGYYPPVFDAEEAGAPVHVHWQQNLSQRKADYYALTVDNITTGEQVPFFIACELYKNSTKANAHHVTKVCDLVDGEGYKMKVDNKLQYGQKNAEGELRFVVYHDQEHKPYQTALGSAGAEKAKKMAEAMGCGGMADSINEIAQSFVGDYMHTF
ncbi:hypothetical protein K438DRAFT_1979216 [Mycena galopus ATCC 62051]|nr:hypothetical protein K438DRAFT_1979216 [Mycena galopus ATCC 62051]